MKTNIQHLYDVLNAVRKFNDLKMAFWYITTIGTFLIIKIMRLLNY
ncbi:hypothetical protein [uncultured Mucilaginibacter sp.]|nr:hypothetical protein [uncultured Mucilaginibacter sp.]